MKSSNEVKIFSFNEVLELWRYSLLGSLYIFEDVIIRE